jgi:hypothetical protein
MLVGLSFLRLYNIYIIISNYVIKESWRNGSALVFGSPLFTKG